MRGSAIFAAIICAGAGGYLLLWESVGTESNWFEAMSRGIGAYMIGKALFILWAGRAENDQLVELRRIADAVDRQHPRPPE